FATFKQNFLSEHTKAKFDWPSWLEQKAHSIDDVLSDHGSRLKALNGSIDVVAGGPPCQGFSTSGRRDEADPRNKLFKKYVELVADVEPRALILENVPGMMSVHGATLRAKRRLPGPVPKSYYEKLLKALDEIGYVASGRI